jgi:hypothetical protein
MPHPTASASRSVRQFDPVGMLPIAFVLFSKDFFKPLCLLLSAPFVCKRRLVKYNEFLTATVTAQGAHFPEIRRFLSALAFSYGNCFHLLTISDCGPLRSFDFSVRAFVHNVTKARPGTAIARH